MLPLCCLGLPFEDFPLLSTDSSLNFIGSNCWTASGFTARLLIPLPVEEDAEVPDDKFDMFEAELVATNVEGNAFDFLETFERFDKLLSLTGICCLIVVLSLGKRRNS